MNIKTPEEGYVKAYLDYAPKENGKEFDMWCERHGFAPLNSGRRAWCSNLSTYFRDALGVASTADGCFLFYESDLFDLTSHTTTLKKTLREEMQGISVPPYPHEGAHGDAISQAAQRGYQDALTDALAIITATLKSREV